MSCRGILILEEEYYVDYEDIIDLDCLFASFKNPGNNYKT